MSYSVKALRALTDDEVIALHDQLAVNTGVGVDYYLDEMRRRDQATASRGSQRLAIASVVLAVASTIASVVAVVIALSQ